MAFAQFEMKLVISSVLSRFELALADSRSVRPVRRGLTAAPSPFRMVVKEHRPTKPLGRAVEMRSAI
jgi:cytochrome P450